MKDDTESGKKSGKQQERPQGRKMENGEHWYYLVFLQPSMPHRQSSCLYFCVLCVCVRFFTILTVLLVQCFTIATGVVAIAVLSEGLNALRHFTLALALA